MGSEATGNSNDANPTDCKVLYGPDGKKLFSQSKDSKPSRSKFFSEKSKSIYYVLIAVIGIPASITGAVTACQQITDYLDEPIAPQLMNPSHLSTGTCKNPTSDDGTDANPPASESPQVDMPGVYLPATQWASNKILKEPEGSAPEEILKDGSVIEIGGIEAQLALTAGDEHGVDITQIEAEIEGTEPAPDGTHMGIVQGGGSTRDWIDMTFDMADPPPIAMVTVESDGDYEMNPYFRDSNSGNQVIQMDAGDTEYINLVALSSGRGLSYCFRYKVSYGSDPNNYILYPPSDEPALKLYGLSESYEVEYRWLSGSDKVARYDCSKDPEDCDP